MAITCKESHAGKLLEIVLTGKLVKEDYKDFLPVVDRLVRQHGKIRMLVEMHDFEGWTPGALWEDIKFDAHHFDDIELLAMVGEKRWHHGLSVFSRPFTAATIRYFEHLDLANAHEWIEAGLQ